MDIRAYSCPKCRLTFEASAIVAHSLTCLNRPRSNSQSFVEDWNLQNERLYSVVEEAEQYSEPEPEESEEDGIPIGDGDSDDLASDGRSSDRSDFAIYGQWIPLNRWLESDEEYLRNEANRIRRLPEVGKVGGLPKVHEYVNQVKASQFDDRYFKNGRLVLLTKLPEVDVGRIGVRVGKRKASKEPLYQLGSKRGTRSELVTELVKPKWYELNLLRGHHIKPTGKMDELTDTDSPDKPLIEERVLKLPVYVEKTETFYRPSEGRTLKFAVGDFEYKPTPIWLVRCGLKAERGSTALEDVTPEPEPEVDLEKLDYLSQLDELSKICKKTCHSLETVSEPHRGTVEVFSIKEDRSWFEFEDWKHEKPIRLIIYRREIAVGPNVALGRRSRRSPLKKPLRFDSNGRYRRRKHLKTPRLGKMVYEIGDNEEVVISSLLVCRKHNRPKCNACKTDFVWRSLPVRGQRLHFYTGKLNRFDCGVREYDENLMPQIVDGKEVTAFLLWRRWYKPLKGRIPYSVNAVTMELIDGLRLREHALTTAERKELEHHRKAWSKEQEREIELLRLFGSFALGRGKGELSS